MIKIGSFEAKTHFSDLLKRVKKGEEILITNRGRVVAKLTSYEEEGPNPKLFIKRAQEFSKGRSCTLKEINEMKEEGRKH